MIPKIIHYCWFGGKSIPPEQQNFINGWKEKCPEWEIRLWNEENFNINEYPFVASAYEQKKYAFVSDYVRVWALNKYGGIYLDTDVEIKHSLNDFLDCDAFSCFETENVAFTSAVWGSISEHSLTQKMLKYYNNRSYEISEPPNTTTITNILKQSYNIDITKDLNQIGSDSINTIHIYSSNYFCLDLPVNYATHHFIGSWLEDENNEPYKKKVHDTYYLNYVMNKELINKKAVLKEIATLINFKNLLSLFRYYIKYKIDLLRKL